MLLATDGSESSREAAQAIAQRPWPAGTEVRILSVIGLPDWQVTLESFVDTARIQFEISPKWSRSMRKRKKRAQDAIMSPPGK